MWCEGESGVHYLGRAAGADEIPRFWHLESTSALSPHDAPCCSVALSDRPKAWANQGVSVVKRNVVVVYRFLVAAPPR